MPSPGPSGGMVSELRVLVERPIEEGLVELPREEALHLRVRRARIGDKVFVVNGRGAEGEGVLVAPNLVEVERVSYPGDRELSVRLTLCVGLLKGDKMDLVVQKATELGASLVVPVVSRRSVARPKPDRVKRWKKIAAQALKQCRRVFLPEIAHPVGVDELEIPEGAYLLWERGGSGFRELLLAHEGDVAVVVGPEGGFCPEEVDALVARGAVAVGLGPVVLRAETAAIFAASVVKFLFGTSP